MTAKASDVLSRPARSAPADLATLALRQPAGHVRITPARRRLSTGMNCRPRRGLRQDGQILFDGNPRSWPRSPILIAGPTRRFDPRIVPPDNRLNAQPSSTIAAISGDAIPHLWRRHRLGYGGSQCPRPLLQASGTLAPVAHRDETGPPPALACWQ